MWRMEGFPNYFHMDAISKGVLISFWLQEAMGEKVMVYARCSVKNFVGRKTFCISLSKKKLFMWMSGGFPDPRHVRLRL